MAAARALGNPYFIAYAYWTAGAAYSSVHADRALRIWAAGLDYVRRHRVDFFVGFIARDAARLRLVDSDPDVALEMFEAAIDAFQHAGNVAQLSITLASATALFERIGRVESAATLYGAIIRQPGAEHHVPELSALAEVLLTRLGAKAFATSVAVGEQMDLNDTAHYCRQEIRVARMELRDAAVTRAARPGGLSKREIDVLQLVASGLTTREIAERLFISAKTADRHIQNLYTKINVSNRAAATRWAVEHDLVD
jgi:DNA-binding CsgD family transcriptional regulator